MEIIIAIIFIYIVSLFSKNPTKENKTIVLPKKTEEDIFQDIVSEVLQNYGSKCVLCGDENITIYPILPYTSGGKRDIYNLVPLCPACIKNMQKISEAISPQIVTNNQKIQCKESLTWQDIRQKVFETYGYRCMLCGSYEQINVHHVIPISRGGCNDIENLVPLCQSCHKKLHSFEFTNSLKKIPDDYGFNVSKCNKNNVAFIIINAIKNKQRVKIKYKSHKLFKNSEITVRIIRPIKYGTGLQFDNEYLINAK